MDYNRYVALRLLLFTHILIRPVQGGEFKYKIDKNYLKSGVTSLYGKPVAGDTSGGVVALKYPMHLEASDLTVDISVLVYNDKIYDDLYGSAFKVLDRDDASLVSNSKSIGLYKYQSDKDREKENEESGSSYTKYIFSFNPLDESTYYKSSVDYYARIKQNATIAIGDREPIVPKKVCRLTILVDSMLLKASGIGSVCEEDKISSIPEKIEKLFSSWKIPTEQSSPVTSALD
ncbi:hypothetical protein OAM69_07045 [bacterium]|nr:hypothetical protein [bacterium]